MVFGVAGSPGMAESTGNYVILTLCWRKQSKYAVILVPIRSSRASIGVWIGVASRREGVMSVVMLLWFYPCVAGIDNLNVLTPFITYERPETYDIAKFREIELVDDKS
ncbi:hypothetical protein BJX64DRAFT_294124 [Aspergillus heterothallicus]